MLKSNGRTVVYASFMSLILPFCAAGAMAHTRHHAHPTLRSHHASLTNGRHGMRHGFRYASYYGRAHVIQCVAFAKQDAGIEIRGNARDWWARAAGIYARGGVPEIGSVLSFRANGRMPLGHVAVVSGVADSRTIEIDQSHWGRSGISRDIEVKDVSEANDWSAVRVQLRNGGEFGSIYPTHGFIYPRPDDGSVTAVNDRAAQPAAMRAEIRTADMTETSIQPARITHKLIEVAEMPATGRSLDLTLPIISADAPDRSLR